MNRYIPALLNALAVLASGEVEVGMETYRSNLASDLYQSGEGRLGHDERRSTCSLVSDAETQLVSFSPCN
jgi:hypothetical protein